MQVYFPRPSLDSNKVKRGVPAVVQWVKDQIAVAGLLWRGCLISGLVEQVKGFGIATAMEQVPVVAWIQSLAQEFLYAVSADIYIYI